MTVDTRALDELGDIDEPVKQMLLALPDFRVGDELHAQMVALVMNAVPGKGPEGVIWRDWLFPGRRGLDDEQVRVLVEATGLGSGWWSDFSVAVVSQSIDAVTSNAGKRLDHGLVDSAVAAANDTLRRNVSLAPAYSYALQTTFDDFKKPFGMVERERAFRQYREALLRSVNIHELWFAAGLWKNPDWELYHHWVKLAALGGAERVDDIIRELARAGLSIPDVVGPGAWRYYTVFLTNRPDVDHDDVDGVCRSALLFTYYAYPDPAPGVPIIPPPTKLPEFYADEFVSGPASRFRRSGGSSCFARGAGVLMADGDFRPIEDIRPGDRIVQPTGIGEVAMVGRPLRAGRPLYSFAGEEFRFTPTHPFVTSEGGPALAAADPIGLHFAVPTFGQSGIAALGEGSVLAGPKEPYVVRGLRRHDESEDDELLYDLIPYPDGGSFEYFVGNPRCVVRTTAELPIADRSPQAGAVLMRVVEEALPLMRKRPSASDKHAYQQDLARLQRLLAAGTVDEALGLVSRTTAQAAPQPIGRDQMHALVRGFTHDRGESDWVFGGLFETVVRALGTEVETALAMPWRLGGMPYGDRLAISLGDLHALDGFDIPTGQRSDLVVSYRVKGRAPWLLKVGESGQRFPTPFVRYFDRVVYVPFRSSDPGDDAELTVGLFIGAAAEPRASAVVAIVNFSHSCRLACFLRDRKSRRLAHLHMEGRLLTEERSAAEQDAQAMNSPELQLDFAARFSRALAEKVQARVVALDTLAPAA